jgi:hypothetical protein
LLPLASIPLELDTAAAAEDEELDAGIDEEEVAGCSESSREKTAASLISTFSEEDAEEAAACAGEFAGYAEAEEEEDML